MALSLESLRSHYAAHPTYPQRIYYFHAHIYFKPEHASVAIAFQDRISKTWQQDDRVKVQHTRSKAAGPHPLPDFEVLFNRGVFTDFLTWLQLERPEELTILVHPLTDKVLPDHTSRAIWLGQQPPGPFGGIKQAPLEDLQRRGQEQGWSEEDYAERLKVGPPVSS